MKAYAIAKRIPLSYRHRMVAVTYRRAGPFAGPRCKTGRCPLGWLFNNDDPHHDAPPGSEVARRLRRFARNKGVQARVLEREANEFIDAFDGYKLKGKALRAALGLRS